MERAPGIYVDGLSFRYQGRQRPALTDVSFEVPAGQALLVLGPSGCGKSTLALCLSGLIPHSVAGELGGKVVIGGSDWRDAPVTELAKTVGLVFQDPDAQFCMLRVDDEIAFGLENLRVPPTEMAYRINHSLDVVGLAGAERTRIDRLSGGARQRLALASVLAMGPPLLVFDEPTSNLDPSGSRKIIDNIAALKADGNRTIVIVEHLLDNVMHFVDLVLAFGSDGRVLAFGPPQQVFRDSAQEFERHGMWVPQVSEIANRLASRGLALSPFPTTVDEAATALEDLLATRSNASLSSDNVVGSGLLPEPTRETSDGSSTRLKQGQGHVVMAPTAVEISHLSWRYPSGQTALRDVSMAISEGSFAAIVGPNGSGKSTLARHLGGSIRPAVGTVRVFGRDAHDMRSSKAPQRIGYVFQNPEHQFVADSVRDELAFGLKVHKYPETEIDARVEAMLEGFGLSSLASANPFTLSHGEKRRLSVAAMLILEPQILLLDEPTLGQDRQNTEKLMAKLVDLNQEGRTIIMITHDLRLVTEYASQVAVLVAGSVAYLGPVDELFADPGRLERGCLTLPPLLDLSRRLSRFDPTFQDVLSLDCFVEEIEGRVLSRSRYDPSHLRARDAAFASGDQACIGPGRV